MRAFLAFFSCCLATVAMADVHVADLSFHTGQSAPIMLADVSDVAVVELPDGRGAGVSFTVSGAARDWLASETVARADEPLIFRPCYIVILESVLDAPVTDGRVVIPVPQGQAFAQRVAEVLSGDRTCSSFP